MSKTYKDTPDATEGPRRPRRGRLDRIPPLAREAIASWIDFTVQKFPELVARERAWLKEHPADRESANQLSYYEHALSYAKFLSYHLRKDM